jgi:signal transduction histidine kinase
VNEQTALRRVATLVARGVPPAELFASVTEEVERTLCVDMALMFRFEPGGMATVVASRGEHTQAMAEGTVWVPEPPLATVLRTGQVSRVDDFRGVSATGADVVDAEGIRSAVASPITVEGRLWGAFGVVSRTEALPADIEQRLVDFTELVATAIANAFSRAELMASRVRIVTAADEVRRRIERDLHDGAQQRIVAHSVKLQSLALAIPPDMDGLQAEIADVAYGLDRVLEELRELCRGIHPVILSEGGLSAALRTLARRASIPVELDVRIEERPPKHIEVAVYYVVAEVLTNAAKYAQASVVHVEVQPLSAVLHVAIQDDGIGGADPSRGTGLVGLRDRVDALSGTMSIVSPPGGGTSILVDLPIRLE